MIGRLGIWVWLVVSVQLRARLAEVRRRRDAGEIPASIAYTVAMVVVALAVALIIKTKVIDSANNVQLEDTGQGK
jgi:hypothetical protein